MGITDTVERMFPIPDGEGPMLHRSAVVTAVNSDGTLTVDLSGVSVVVNALAGSVARVGDTVHLAAWAGDLISLGRARSTAGGGVASGLMIPASATVDGGGASVSVANGRVTFAAATAVHVNGCFTAGFGRFKIEARYTRSAATIGSVRLRAAGTDNATANSYVTKGFKTDGSSTSYRNTTSTLWQIDNGDAGVGEMVVATLRLDRPAVAIKTVADCRFVDEIAAGAILSGSLGLFHTQAVAYDGFTFFVASGASSGSLYVVGDGPA